MGPGCVPAPRSPGGMTPSRGTGPRNPAVAEFLPVLRRQPRRILMPFQGGQPRARSRGPHSGQLRRPRDRGSELRGAQHRGRGPRPGQPCRASRRQARGAAGDEPRRQARGKGGQTRRRRPGGEITANESRSGWTCYVPDLQVGPHHRGYGRRRERQGLRGARVPTTTRRCRRQLLCLVGG